jgi:RNA polymerase sigma-70 factor, ECF subfamily
VAWRNKKYAREEFAREAMLHLDHLYRVAFHLVKEPDEAQDLVQETYTRALSSYEQFATGTHLKAWLGKILHNLFFDHYREAKRWLSVEENKAGKDEEWDCWENVPRETPGPESDILNKELSNNITDAIKKLPEEFRMPIILVDVGDFSYAEAAQILSCPLGTVRSRLFRGRQLLRERLRDYVEAKYKQRK